MFLHGVETIEVERGTRPIRSVRTAVIGLVGTAPIWEVAAENQTVNEAVLVTGPADAAKYFGTARTGYTIPQALDAIFDQGNGPIVVVVNVFDPDTAKVAVAAAEYTFDANGLITLAYQGVQTVVVKSQDLATTYVEGDDYTVDPITGKVTRGADGDIGAGATVSITLERPDLTAVEAADLIGTMDGSGNRTGLKALQDSASQYGFSPKLLLAPAFCTQDSVVAELLVQAEALRAHALIDAPIGTTVANAIAGRGAGAAINFETSSKRAILCYPHVKVYDASTDSEVLEPLSQRAAGVIAAKDYAQGFWNSPSNTEILGIVGVERALTSGVSDANSEVNQLNAAGITTVFQAYGTGIRLWGNRSAAYPSSSHPSNFISIQRVADVLHDSVELAMLQYLDKPINDALIDSITQSVDAYINSLVGRGALIDGSCTYDPAKNPSAEIADGHLTFDISFMPPAPAERISFESYIDTSLLSTLGAGQTA